MCVLAAVDTLTCAAAVEAVQANIETGGLIDVVEAEGAVFAVNRVGGSRRGDVGGLDVRTGGHVGWWWVARWWLSFACGEVDQQQLAWRCCKCKAR